MKKAICIACGSRKRAPYAPCCRCGFDPGVDDESLVRSVYLSTSRYPLPEQKEERQQYAKQLDMYAEMIRRRQQIVFEEAELARLAANLVLMRSVPRAAVWGAVFRLFLPGVLFVAGVWLFYFLLRWLL
jgi:hypothetical protein